jgi:hypothetical protein
MGGSRWFQEEESLTIWFASLGIAHTTIVILLKARGFCRTLTGVRNKISEIRKKHSLGGSSIRMIETEVDRWLDYSSTTIDVSELLRPTQDDLRIIFQVSIVEERCMCWSFP